MSTPKMASSIGKTLLKNIIRHTDTHNRLLEEDDMWRQHKDRPSYRHSDRRSHRPRRRRSSSPRLSTAHMDCPEDTEPRRYAEDDDPRTASTYWTRQLYKAEEKDPDRWGHGGYKELYPDEFHSDRSVSDADDRRRKHSGKKKRKHKRDRKRKHKRDTSKERKKLNKRHKHQGSESPTEADAKSCSSSSKQHKSKRHRATSPYPSSSRKRRHSETEQHASNHRTMTAFSSPSDNSEAEDISGSQGPTQSHESPRKSRNYRSNNFSASDRRRRRRTSESENDIHSDDAKRMRPAHNRKRTKDDKFHNSTSSNNMKWKRISPSDDSDRSSDSD